MSYRPFTSESYAERDRLEAWRDVLNGVGLQPLPTPTFYSGHANGVQRTARGLTLAKLSAGSQGIAPLSRTGDAALPILVLPIEDGCVLRNAGHRIVPSGHLLLLPPCGDWNLLFQREFHAIVLHVTADAFHGRIFSGTKWFEPQAIAPIGFADVLARNLEAAAQTMDQLSEREWEAIAQSLSELLLTLTRQIPVSAADQERNPARSASMARICQTIERRLDDPKLSPSHIAQAEGISERYLQKLFEQTDDNFTHYVRERRLQRASADFSNPSEAIRTISEIAYRYGFSDSAHFSRAFRARFGLSPREFRQQKVDRSAASASITGHRGWPRAALAKQSQQKAATAIKPTVEHLECERPALKNGASHHHFAIAPERVHWGYFSHSLQPQAEIRSGDTISIETLTQHASDDPERMISGDSAAEEIFRWTRDHKTIDRRGAGPMDASVFGRGAGEGFGVHICSGPIAITDALPGDVLEVRILDIKPRLSQNPDYAGRVFGSSVAAWWGYHFDEFVAEPKSREVVTIYEIFNDAPDPYALGTYSYRWEPQTDPYGITHRSYDYPGVLVAAGSVRRRHDVLKGIRIPLRPHFGVIAVAPREADFVDSVPPSYFGGNLDNWRLGKGAAVYLPVSVPGALLSVGDPHAAQGDGEISGTAIECSMTGTFQVTLHKKHDLAGQPFADLSYPLIETPTEWVLTGFSHPNYLAEFGPRGQSEVYAKSSLDLAMKDAFRKMRRFLMNIEGLSEDEALALMSAAVDFGVTQVVDGNWGVHAVLRKSVFDGAQFCK